MEKLNETIRLLRNKAGFSQEVMAESLKVNTSNYSKLERGTIEMTLPKLQKIAEIFSMSVIDLLTYGENKAYGLVVNNNQSTIGVQNNYAAENLELKQTVNELQNRVTYLEERVSSLTEKNNLKDKIILFLEKSIDTQTNETKP